MAPALTDGVPGLEALHTLTPPSPFSTFTLNDHEDPTTGLTVLPHTRLRDVQGIHDRPDADDPRVNLVYQHGELPLPRYSRGRTITYNGVVVASSLSGLRSKVAALRAACTSALHDPTAWYVSVAYNATYDPHGYVYQGFGIPVGFTCDDQQGSGDQAPTPYQRDFVMSFRQSDGRWWVTSDTVSVGSSGSKLNDGSAHVLTMPGTAPSEPTFTVYGTGAGAATIVLSHAELSHTLTVDLPVAMSSGDLLVVNFGQRTITFTPSGGSPTDYSGYLDWNNTDWWEEGGGANPLLIGTNTLTVAGDKWSVTAIPACW